MLRRSVLAGFVLAPLGSLASLAAGAPCTYQLPTTPTESAWGKPVHLEYSPISVSVDRRTNNVTFQFRKGKPVTVNPFEPVPDPVSTDFRSQHLMRHLHKVAKVYLRRCGAELP